MKQLQSVFCDDLRQEVGGKLTYVGVYSSALWVAAFPTLLPKFVVAVTLIADSLPRIGEVEFTILRDAEVIAERTLDTAALTSASLAALQGGTGSDSEKVQVVTAYFAFSPFQIDAPCTLRVRATVDGVELKALGLRIDLLPTAA